MPAFLGLEKTFLGDMFLNYISPTTILIAVYMGVGFSKLKIQNKVINWLGASSFAVFLLHTNPNVIYHYVDLFKGIHELYEGVYYWLISIPILVVIFMLAVLIDQVRIVVWKKLWSIIEHKLSKS